MFAVGEFVLVCWFCFVSLSLATLLLCAGVVVLHWLALWKEWEVKATKRRDEFRGSRGRSGESAGRCNYDCGSALRLMCGR